jgi:hypothetical protein
MIKLLIEHEISATSEKEIVKDIANKLDYIILDYEIEIDRTYKLSDGNAATIGSEIFHKSRNTFQIIF